MRLLAALTLAVTACEPEVPFASPAALSFYAASDRDGLGTPEGNACHRLRTLGCPEGFRTRADRTCFERMTEIGRSLDTRLPCLTTARGVDDVRECGWQETLRIRCVMPAVDEPGSALP